MVAGYSAGTDQPGSVFAIFPDERGGCEAAGTFGASSPLLREPLSTSAALLFAVAGSALLCCWRFCVGHGGDGVRETRTRMSGSALLVLLGVATAARHLLGMPLLALVCTGLHALFQLWFLEAWLRCVALVSSRLRRAACLVLLSAVEVVLTLVALPAVLVDAAAPYAPAVVYAFAVIWPLLILMTLSALHVGLARRRKMAPLAAFMLLLVAATLAATETLQCDAVEALVGVGIGLRFAAYAATASGYSLLVLALPATSLDGSPLPGVRSTRGWAHAEQEMSRQSQMPRVATRSRSGRFLAPVAREYSGMIDLDAHSREPSPAKNDHNMMVARV